MRGAGRDPARAVRNAKDAPVDLAALRAEVDALESGRGPRGGDERRPGRRPVREREGRERGPVFRARLEGVLRDAGAFRCVAVSDLVDSRFGGNRFAAVRGIERLEREGLVKAAEGRGPRGGRFRMLALTPAGRDHIERLAWAGADSSRQRWWAGDVQARQASHDTAVYRAARAEIEKIREAGGTFRRVIVDSELKSIVARRVEAARAQGGRGAAEAEKRAVAGELGLPVVDGRVRFPDARLEYRDDRDGDRWLDLEITTGHYRAATVAAKASAGFKVYAAGRVAAGALARAAGRGGGGLGRIGSISRGGGGPGGGGGGRGRDKGVLEL